MSNSAPSSAAGAAATSSAAAGLVLPQSASLPVSSSTPRLTARKRANAVAAASSTKSLLDSADASTPVRRTASRDLSSSYNDGDPSAVMVAGTVELAGDYDVPERVAVPRSTAKSSAQIIGSSPSVPTKPRILKLSLQPKPQPKTGAGATAVTSRPRPSNYRISGTSFVLLFLVLVACLATTFWDRKDPTFGAISMEGQVAEIEDILRKTTKMMQVQLDLVDIKLHKEIETLRKELEEKIHEQTTSFNTELKNIRARTQDIEASLKSLMNAGFPTRHDVLNLITSVVNERASEGTGEALSLDDVRAVARRIVEAELEKHAADGIGRVDYALKAGGGKVVDHSEGFYRGLKMGLPQLVGSFLPGNNYKHSLADKILEPSFGEPGQCLPLKGSNVYVEVALRTSIYPDAFSLEHVSKSVAYDVSSAPKDFQVFGWLDSIKKGDTVEKPMLQYFLGEFTYDIEKKSVQTFVIPQDSNGRGKLINMVKFEVLSNYGSPSHTCIYRFRVHGSDSKSNVLKD